MVISALQMIACSVRSFTSWRQVEVTMRGNIMFWPAVVLMVVEAAALIFLVREWKKAKKEQGEKEDGK